MTPEQAINELWSSPYYRAIVEAIEKMAPLIPTYDFNSPNIEEWKVRSSQKQLHDMVMARLKPKEV